MGRLSSFLFLSAFLALGCAQAPKEMGDWTVQINQHESEDSYYELRIEFPEFSCVNDSDCGADELNEEVLSLVNSHWKEFRGEELELKKKFIQENYPEHSDEGRKFSLEINQEVFENGRYLSLLFQINRYELGAHANLLYKSIVYDRYSKHLLKLTDVILDFELNVGKLNALLTEKLEQVDPCFDQSVNLTSQFENFSLSDEGIQFHFEPYELGAYVCGPVSLVATEQELKDLDLWGLGQH